MSDTETEHEDGAKRVAVTPLVSDTQTTSSRVNPPVTFEGGEPVFTPNVPALEADTRPASQQWATRFVLGWQRTRRWIARIARRIVRPWRRSLHVRVMSITVLLGMLVALALGSLMYQRIADGLVNAKLESSQQSAKSARSAVEERFSNVEKTDASTLYQVGQESVSSIASADERSQQVVLERANGNSNPAIPTMASSARDTAVIPNSIKDALAADPTHQQTMTITVTADDGSAVPAVLVGSRVAIPNSGDYDLFLIFPMDAETQTLRIVLGSFVLGGFVLVALLGGLAYMVTRMVVTPVRSARHVAERLAAGALNERMEVRGEDDLARLANSFNAMADSLQLQIRQLRNLSEVQQRFTSDVSHELRTPLTTIRMAADLLHASRGDFAAPVSRSAELLHTELDRFESLLADLLEISRFDAGAADLEGDQVDLRDVVRRVVESHTSLAERAGTPLVVHADEPAFAEMDARRVERIVRNLVSNAIEHGDGQPIDITVGAGETAVAVAVRDHGIGLRPGDASMVFSRFWRADPARARTTGGTGLGLAIALEDARLHGGWLQAWGEPGEGSCFRLTLPLRVGESITRSPVTLVEGRNADDLPDPGIADKRVNPALPPANS